MTRRASSDLGRRTPPNESTDGASALHEQQLDEVKGDGGVMEAAVAVCQSEDEVAEKEAEEAAGEEAAGVKDEVHSVQQRDANQAGRNEEGALAVSEQPPQKHTLDFSLTLEDMSLVAFDTTTQHQFVSDLAANLGVEAHDVEVVNYTAGSLVVEARIWGLGSAAHAQEMAVRVRHKGFAGVLLRHRFGPCAVHGICIKEEPRAEDEDLMSSTSTPHAGPSNGKPTAVQEAEPVGANCEEGEQISSDLGGGYQAHEPSSGPLGKSEHERPGEPEVSDESDESEHEHHVEFSIVLHDHDIASFHDGHQAALLEILHGHMGGHLDGHVVELDGFEVGSLVVRLRVRHPPGSKDHHVDKTVDFLSDHSALSEKLVS